MAQSELAALLGRTPKRALYRKYLLASYAENTRCAYDADIAHFRQWGGRIPATAMQVAQYLAFFAGKLAFATLRRRVTAIHREHAARGRRSPAKSELVRATLRGIARTYTVRQRKVRPLVPNQLKQMLRHMTGALGARDKALLLLGFLGGFRRSELIALDICDIAFARTSVLVTVRKSKTDQEGVGRVVRIPALRTPLCAVQALKTWLRIRRLRDGPLFSAVYGRRAGCSRLVGLTVAHIVKRRVGEIGLDPREYSGHSLRAGFVTSAAKAGAPIWAIKQQTGHKSDAVLAGYIRDGAIAGANAARLVGTVVIGH